MPLVIKNSLNLIKGEAGCLSNPKRGQAINYCNQIVNEIVKCVISKRDNESTKPESNIQVIQKDSTQVDTNPGFKFQDNKKDSTKKVDKQLGGGDGVGDEVGANEVGDVAGEKNNGKLKIECNICGNFSNNTSENYSHISSKHSHTVPTQSPVKPEICFECLICGKLSKMNRDHKKHLSETHSIFAQTIANKAVKKNFVKPQKLLRCTKCDRNFFFSQTFENHTKTCHIDFSIIGGGK